MEAWNHATAATERTKNENELKTKNLLERKRFRQEPSYCPNKLLPFFNYPNAFIYFTFLH